MMIAVTGTGVISPLGLDPTAAFRAACAGEDVFRPVATRAAPVTAAALPEVLELPSLPPGFSAGRRSLRDPRRRGGGRRAAAGGADG